MANPNLIPMRRPIGAIMAEQVAQSEYNRLISGWGLVNVKKISTALNKRIKAEDKRRKELE